MFRKKDPQGSLFETSNLVPASKVHRLQASWAEPFRVRGLPLIDEDLFAPLYCDDHGRPNRPVQTVFGVLLQRHGGEDRRQERIRRRDVEDFLGQVFETGVAASM